MIIVNTDRADRVVDAAGETRAVEYGHGDARMMMMKMVMVMMIALMAIMAMMAHGV